MIAAYVIGCLVVVAYTVALVLTRSPTRPHPRPRPHRLPVVEPAPRQRAMRPMVEELPLPVFDWDSLDRQPEPAQPEPAPTPVEPAPTGRRSLTDTAYLDRMISEILPDREPLPDRDAS